MKNHTGRLEFGEERPCVDEGDGGGEQLLSGTQSWIGCRFGKTPEVQPGPVTIHLAVVRGLAVQKGNLESEFSGVEFTRSCNIGHKELRFGGYEFR